MQHFLDRLKFIKNMRLNNIELTTSLWLYTINGKNQKLLQLAIEKENKEILQAQQ